MYKALIRPLLFRLSPALAHDYAFQALGALEHVAPLRALVRAALAPSDPCLRVETLGLSFPSPLGVAGGFDKGARRPKSLAALGFGFLELGTVTALAQTPNDPPNLFRLPDDRALINRMGFPNEGAEAVAARFAQAGGPTSTGVPVGFSIGKSRLVPVDDLDKVREDYLASFRLVRPVSDFVVVNVSSPNTKGLRAIQSAEMARPLLKALLDENQSFGKPLPILLKIAPDLSDEDVESLAAVVRDVGASGIVATNTTISRDGLRTPSAAVAKMGAGGLSGPPVRARALDVVRRVRTVLGPKLTVIGVGGVETSEHALALIRAGANLVQMYTGFIYEGPLAPSRIARELCAAVERAGAKSIADLVSS